MAVNWFGQKKKLESEFQPHKCFEVSLRETEGLHSQTTSDPLRNDVSQGSVIDSVSTPVSQDRDSLQPSSHITTVSCSVHPTAPRIPQESPRGEDRWALRMEWSHNLSSWQRWAFSIPFINSVWFFHYKNEDAFHRIKTLSLTSRPRNDLYKAHKSFPSSCLKEK